MEALGLGANVTAFVVIAAQLSTLLYTTFSSIKDGPDNVRRVAAHLLQLHGVLEQLRRSSLASSDTALAGHVGLCVSDLNSLADSIQKLQLTPDEAGTGRLWKRFKSFLDEKKLDRICDQIVAHTGTLSLRLSILNSNTTCELISGACTMNQLINGLSGSVEKQTESLTSKFGDIDNTLQTQHDKLQTGLTSIQAAVGDMVHMSQTKADSMLDLLVEIKNTIVNPTRDARQPGTVTNNTSEQRSEGNNEEVVADKNGKSALYANLVQSITRLCCLIKEKNRTFDTDAEDNTQAEDIIEDLQMLLVSAQRYETTVSSTIEHSSTNRKLLRSNLRRFGQAFGQFRLLVNQEAGRDNRLPSTATRRKRTYTTVFLQGLGTLSLMVTKQTRGSNATEEISTMAFSFLPKDPRQFMMIVASTTQGGMPGGSISPISRLAVNRVLPAGSQVFNVVEKGLLQELRAMLQGDEATLRDHDEYGANLLFYAVYGRQAKMCKSLLENGADVDHVANTRGLTWGRTDDPRFVLDIYSMTDYMTHFEHETQNCGRLLLEAGADPTARVPGTTSFLEYATCYSRLEPFKLVWGSGLTKLFADINNTGLDSPQPLLFACRHFSEKGIAERICQFLDAGANARLHDDRGQSCLHMCLQNARPQSRPLRNLIRSQFHVIKLLIERGADVYAVDLYGESVSELAYIEMSRYSFRGGFVGDLWDAALQSCGYDIAEFRKYHKRKGCYTRHYPREVFEVLWEGREGQCPYWDDATWPPDAPWHPPTKDRERATDVLGNDEPEGSEGSLTTSNMDEDGISIGKDRCWQEQPALENSREIDSHVRPEASETQTEPTSTIEDDSKKENAAHEQKREFMGNVEFSGLFENPWI